jgi:hypothetical protein
MRFAGGRRQFHKAISNKLAKRPRIGRKAKLRAAITSAVLLPRLMLAIITSNRLPLIAYGDHKQRKS